MPLINILGFARPASVTDTQLSPCTVWSTINELTMNEFPGIVQQRTTNWVLKRARLHYLSSRGDKSKTRCGQSYAPSEICRGEFFFFFSLLPSSTYCQSLAFFCLQVHHFNLCLHCHTVIFSLCALSLFSCSLKDTSHIGLGSTLRTSS